MDPFDSQNPERESVDRQEASKTAKVVNAQYAGESSTTDYRLPPRIILEQQGRTLRRVLFLLLLIALGVSVMFNFGLLAQYHSYIQSDPGMEEMLEAGNLIANDKIEC